MSLLTRYKKYKARYCNIYFKVALFSLFVCSTMKSDFLIEILCNKNLFQAMIFAYLKIINIKVAKILPVKNLNDIQHSEN